MHLRLLSIFLTIFAVQSVRERTAESRIIGAVEYVREISLLGSNEHMDIQDLAGQPSSKPTITIPPVQPSSQPSLKPSIQPMLRTSNNPSTHPTSRPSRQPVTMPTFQPSSQPHSQPTHQPFIQPSSRPSFQPTLQPACQPTHQPSRQPSRQPTCQPSGQPSRQPISRPSRQPSLQPSSQPSIQPVSKPSQKPLLEPSVQPSRQPTQQPSRQPISRPSRQPSLQPSSQPSMQPVSRPSSQPSMQPVSTPSQKPLSEPSVQPSRQPMARPTLYPSSQPSVEPSSWPSLQPSSRPSSQPMRHPSSRPSLQPSSRPSSQPMRHPSSSPSLQPLSRPSQKPSDAPTMKPSLQPSTHPTSKPNHPTSQPTTQPQLQPTRQPTLHPTSPTAQPSRQPSFQPTKQPTVSPSRPTAQPTSRPSKKPSRQPLGQPSSRPTFQPSCRPSIPTSQPSSRPSKPSSQPTGRPTMQPTVQPSSYPTSPTAQPSSQPTSPTGQPSTQPSLQPTRQPTRRPSSQPTCKPTSPTSQPSLQPTTRPTQKPMSRPTRQPLTQPSLQPSSEPTQKPSIRPTDVPSCQPAVRPTAQPTLQPSHKPSSEPSKLPSGQPTSFPSAAPSRQPNSPPTIKPSSQPSLKPTQRPSLQPLSRPSMQPSSQPSLQPTVQPSAIPSQRPSARPTLQPTSQPSRQPISHPTSQPSTQPSSQPSRQPVSLPTTQPSTQPSSQPSRQPISHPTTQPSTQPSSQPSRQPISHPTSQPSTQPASRPSAQPSFQPASRPSDVPSSPPSSQPTAQPNGQPSAKPSRQPINRPSNQPSVQPSLQPSLQPSSRPSSKPSPQPTSRPSIQPSFQPSDHPTSQPSIQPSRQPNSRPSAQPSSQPSSQPSMQPSEQSSSQPSSKPSTSPRLQPSSQPSKQPSSHPSAQPTSQPSVQPSRQPSSQPNDQPSLQPSSQPTKHPTSQPSMQPSRQPNSRPSAQPSLQPSSQPSTKPSSHPSAQPSVQPKSMPSKQPSFQPSIQPSLQPSIQPSLQPTAQPTHQPNSKPSSQPSSQPALQPSKQPSSHPSVQPNSQPSLQPYGQPSSQPTNKPSLQPSLQPTDHPTRQPSTQPSRQPYSRPTGQPSLQPSSQPSMQPSEQPSSRPSPSPSVQPSLQPTYQPSLQPLPQPTCQPSATPSTHPISQPSSDPSMQPSSQPSTQPILCPSTRPSRQPTGLPSSRPSVKPSMQPRSEPSMQPRSKPSMQPRCKPSMQPLAEPSMQPRSEPSMQPRSKPSMQPRSKPSAQPSRRPSSQPVSYPSALPSGWPSSEPSPQPSRPQTVQPTAHPTSQPSRQPSLQPMRQPSKQPVAQPSAHPTAQPSDNPTIQPSTHPSSEPTDQPSTQPNIVPTDQPSAQPIAFPTAQPSSQPSDKPVGLPTIQPMEQPTDQPTAQPTVKPSSLPSSKPNSNPSVKPSGIPTTVPSPSPTPIPTTVPTYIPTPLPSILTTTKPTELPSKPPTARSTHFPTKLPTVEPTSTTLPSPFPSSAPLPASSTRYPSAPRSAVVSIGDQPALHSFDASTKLIVSARVQMLSAGQCDWSTANTSSLLLAAAAKTPLSILVEAPNTLMINLVLPPYTLSAGTVYSFSLTCGDITGTVIIRTNAPPYGGVLAVAPSQGVEIQTLFRLSTHDWRDPDLPLTYQFGFRSSSSFSSSLPTTTMIIQSRSVAQFANSTLPGGVIDCVVQVFDSLGVSSQMNHTVRVQLTDAEAAAAAISSQLLSNSRDPIALKKTLAVANAIMNRIDCSASPPCDKLNRAGCASTANTCGPCQDGYVGDSGDQNLPCFELGTILSPTIVKCSKNTDCETWQFCNGRKGMCEASNKVCLNGCSGRGSCRFIQMEAGTTLSACTLSDSTCTTECVCSSGYFGVSCNVTASQLLAQQQLRTRVVTSLASLTTAESATTENVLNWATNLAQATADPLQLSSQATATTQDVTLSILSGAASAGVAVSGLGGVLAAVDASATASLSLQPDGHRLLSTSHDNTTSAQDLFASKMMRALDLYGKLATRDLAVGEDSAEVLMKTFRISSMAASSVGNVTVSLPLSKSEIRAGKQPASVIIFGTGGFYSQAQGALKVSVSSINAVVFGNSSVSGYLASPVHARVIPADPANADAATVYFVLPNIMARDIAVIRSVQNITFECAYGNVDLLNAVCADSGFEVTHQCSGAAERAVYSCPGKVEGSACHTLSGPASACRVLSFSPTNTTCVCRRDGGSRRKLDSDTAAAEKSIGLTVDVTAVVAFSFLEFASVMESGTDFNSAQALEDTYLVSTAFAVLWLSMFTIVLMANAKSSNVSQASQTMASKVAPSNEMIAGAEAGATLDVEKEINEYISTFFPKAFEEKPRMERCRDALLSNHRYFTTIWRETGYTQWIGVLELLTHLSAQMFLLAMFYDIQWPSDDGNCGHFSTESACLARRSIFNSRQSVCQWVQEAHAIPPGRSAIEICRWQNPSFDTETFLVVSFIVLSLSVPVYVVIAVVFTHVLLAPSPRDLEEQHAQRDTRRKSIAVRAQSQAPSGAVDSHCVLVDHNESAAVTVNAIATSAVASTATAVAHAPRPAFLTTLLPRNDIPSTSPQLQGGRSSGVRFVSTSRTLNPRLSGAMKTAHHRASLAQFFNEKKRDGNNDACCMVTLELVRKDLLSYADTLEGRDKQLFLEEWSCVLRSGHGSEDGDMKKCLRDPVTELVRVRDCVQRLVAEMKKRDESNDLLAVQILQLFALDLLGAGSREAKVFQNHLNVVENKLVLSWSIKSIVISAMLLLNVFFVFACMLYGRAKGLSWQRHWILGSIANLIVDIVFKHVSIAITVYFLVPDAIHDRTVAMKRTLEGAVHKLCSHLEASSARATTASTYATVATHQDTHTSVAISPSQAFFVSTHVAKAFPNTLESSLVLAHRWTSPPPACRPRNLARRQGSKVGSNNSDGSSEEEEKRPRSDVISRSLRFALAQLLTWFLVLLGSQLPLVQKVATGIISTLAVYAIAYLVTGVMRVALHLQWIFLFGVAFFVVVISPKKQVRTRLGQISGVVAPLNAGGLDDDRDGIDNHDNDGDISQPSSRASPRKKSDRDLSRSGREMFELVFEGSSAQDDGSKAEEGEIGGGNFAGPAHHNMHDAAFYTATTVNNNETSDAHDKREKSFGTQGGLDSSGDRWRQEDAEAPQGRISSLDSDSFEYSFSIPPCSENKASISSKPPDIDYQITAAAKAVFSGGESSGDRHDVDDSLSRGRNKFDYSMAIQSRSQQQSSSIRSADITADPASRGLEFNFSSDPSSSHGVHYEQQAAQPAAGLHFEFSSDSSSSRGSRDQQQQQQQQEAGLHFDFSSESED